MRCERRLLKERRGNFGTVQFGRMRTVETGSAKIRLHAVVADERSALVTLRARVTETIGDEHAIAFFETDYPAAGFLDYTEAFMAEYDRHLHQPLGRDISVTDPGGFDTDQQFIGTQIVEYDGL